MVALYPRHDGPNSAFRGTTSEDAWIELYHSRPSWRVSQISFRKDGGNWIPFGKYQLIDAAEIKPGFRAFRIKAKRIEFRLANERTSVIDSNLGRNYVISAAGRYVVESGSGCRRVADAQVADCLRASRPDDRFVELSFESNPLWRRCFVSYAVEGEGHRAWRKLPMEARGDNSASWFQRVEASGGVVCAFSNGASEWDSNKGRNYKTRLPGRYVLGGGHMTYCGVSDLDVHLS